MFLSWAPASLPFSKLNKRSCSLSSQNLYANLTIVMLPWPHPQLYISCLSSKSQPEKGHRETHRGRTAM